MEERYIIHLACSAQGWCGELTTEAGKIPFQGLDTLLELLGGAALLGADVERLRREAMTDLLTGGLNRRGLELAAQKMLLRKPQEQVALLFLDIDDLKRINDTWGHLCGDRVLQTVAHTIRTCVGIAGVVGRYSGDEFVVLFPQMENGGVLRAQAEEICRAVSAAGAEYALSISAGAALGRPGCCYEELLLQADQALYQVKRQGKNGCALWGDGPES